jgi:AcrR family transcriptional regulator
MAGTGAPARRGRPRDTSIDMRVLDATRELLTEVGFDATTVQAIAQRSGTPGSAIYRRWPTRTAIIEQAIFPGLTSVQVLPSGDLRHDLRRFIRAYLAAFGAPAARAAMPGLLASYEGQEADSQPSRWLSVSTRPQFLDILRAAGPESVDPSVDAEDVFDVLLGAMLARTLITTVSRRNRPIERLVELTVRLVQPCDHRAGSQVAAI